MGALGWPELLIIFGILLLVFGASRLPGVARSLGKSIGSFKKGLNEDAVPEDEELEKDTAEEEKKKQ